MATVRLQSQPYIGVPIEVYVSKPGGVSSSDYVAIYSGATRHDWKWAQPPSHVVQRFSGKEVFSGTTQVGLAAANRRRLVYFEGGGVVAMGTTIATAEVVFENPLQSLAAAVVMQQEEQRGGGGGGGGGGGAIQVAFALAVAIPAARATLMQDGVVLAERAIPAGASTVRLPLPRVAGAFDVELQTRAEANHYCTLGRAVVQVSPATCPEVGVLLSSPSPPLQAPCGVVSARPRTDVLALTNGVLHDHLDRIFVLPLERDLRPPTTSAFQKPLMQCRAGSARLRFPDEGVYSVCHAARQESGAFLMGGHAVLIVTSKAPQEDNPPSPPSSESSSSSSSSSSSCCSSPAASTTPVAASGAVADEKFLCSVCRESDVSVRLDPCNHVCLCETCAAHMRHVGQLRQCPLCRAAVSRAERVFFA
jgi:hypothetical protein